MKQKSDIEKRIEQTLESLNGIQRAEPQPWLYSRVQSRIRQEEDKTIWGTIGSFLARPVVAIAGLCLILLLNGLFVAEQANKSSSVSQNEQQQPDSESLIASSSSFEYEHFIQP